MAAVIGLRGLERGDNFELATNVTNAGNFDDLVYTAGNRRYFLQLKHTENRGRKMLNGDLLKLLQKSLQSYCDIKRCDNFKDIPIDNSHFIIYTNEQLTQTLLKQNRTKREDDIFFKTCDKGEIFSFSQENKNILIDMYTLLEDDAKQSKEFRDSCDREILNEFLKNFILITGQKGQSELDEVIAEEIRKHLAANDDNEVYKAELLEFKTQVEIWCRDKKEKMTATTFRNWLQAAKNKACAAVFRSSFKNGTTTLVKTGIKFSHSEISRLQTELSDRPVVHLRSDALTLCSILLQDCLDTSKCIFITFELLRSNKTLLQHAWFGGHWGWLIVFCDSTVMQSDISDTCLEISENITCAPSSKRVIILTTCSVAKIADFIPIEHKFTFEQLSKESQEIVLDKKIDFQGCEVTMRSVLQRHGNVQHVLGPELVTELITEGTAINIGGRLQANGGYYAPRILERKIWLRSNVLQNLNHVFVVDGTTMEDLHQIVPSGKTVEYVSLEEIYVRNFTEDMRGRIFLLPKADAENCFLEICKKLEGRPLHWVEFKDGFLLWKMSQGDTESLLDYIDADKTRADMRIITEWMKSGSSEVNEELIWKMGERTVLVVAEPGMGKSSTTKHVAWNTKLADRTWWVVRINWNDHTRKLQEIDTETFNFDSLVEFLCSAAFTESKYTDINRNLLKQALQYSGNVTVLMDGFDEISPTHADKAAVILSKLMKTKVERVWVTSRPVEKERLEKELCVCSFSMKRLSRASQKEMLRKLWKCKAGKKEEKLNDFLSSVNKSVHDENFTGCPLYITTIATAYEMEKEKYLNPEDSQCPEIDFLKLYAKFLERKLHIYLTEKRKAEETNSCVLDDDECLKETYLKNFEKCALVAILSPSILKSLHNKKIEESLQPVLRRVQAGRDKTGIVMNVVDGKPQFVHPTFAEYFTARWFSRNFEFNRSVMGDILFDHTYWGIKDMFDRILAEDCPLHCAVLQSDKERFETLMEEGSDVSAVDKGGRTVMHIIATRHWMPSEIINTISKCRVFLDTRDCVLQWTPLQYAIKSGNWFIVERLLESSVDRCGLDMIRQRKEDTDYINPIIMHAATHGYLLLLEFLYSIGVNIHQTSERGIPAMQGEQLLVGKSLIEPGANCNTRYSDGKTLSVQADTEGSLDVRTLEEGVASLYVHDTRGK